MWTRKELKADAKAAFKRNYWRSVLVGVLCLLIIGAVGFSSVGGGMTKEAKDAIDAAVAGSGFSVTTFWSVVTGVAIGCTIISALIAVFLRNPLTVGVQRFFYQNTKEPAKVGNMGYAFTGKRYLKTVATMILKNLFIGLFTLLLIIPGIIKMFDYCMVEFILADNPTMSPMEALRKSKDMMRGNRWKTFVLNLSFLPWMLLSVLTLGILDIFYVAPYVFQTNAELYCALKENK